MIQRKHGTRDRDEWAGDQIQQRNSVIPTTRDTGSHPETYTGDTRTNESEELSEYLRISHVIQVVRIP